jgi:hypothetical protein
MIEAFNVPATNVNIQVVISLALSQATAAEFAKLSLESLVCYELPQKEA